VEYFNLERKYGVVRYLATAKGHREQELVFQSDDPMAARLELQARVAFDYSDHGHKIMLKEVYR
jgi:hypothetical protein